MASRRSLGHDDSGGALRGKNGAPLRGLDEAAIRAATLHDDPCDYAFVEHALPLALTEQVRSDAPRIPDRGSYGLLDL